jgi:hypothetical protein
MYSSRYSCAILMKLVFPGQVFGKKTRISNFVEIRPGGAEVFYAHGLTDKRGDRNDEANSRYSQFWRTRVKNAAVSCIILLSPHPNYTTSHSKIQ